MTDRATQQQIEWIHDYDGYARLAAPPELRQMIAPAHEHYERYGAVPEWCGVDLLRGWAFYLCRADRHTAMGEYGAYDEEILAVLAAIQAHPHATRQDLPPGL